MDAYFKNYLFDHGYLVNDNNEKSENVFEILFSIAKYFNIQITSGQEKVSKEMIQFLQNKLCVDVPAPFYIGFPESVKRLTSNELLLDQLLHYTHTYGFGFFDEQGHSVLEEFLEKEAFHENSSPMRLAVLSEAEAMLKLTEYAQGLLAGTRPLQDAQVAFLVEFIKKYNYVVENCASKNTAIRLLLEMRDVRFADFLQLSDVIKMVEELNFRNYKEKTIKKLNLKNQDRKFVTAVINRFFVAARCDIRTCFEKKASWNGLLHHIHYRPVNDLAAQFVQYMRGDKNFSVYAEFEKAMSEKNFRAAVTALKREKGSGAILRNLNYIVSRFGSPKDIAFLMDQLDNTGGIVLLQLLMMYANYKEDGSARTFTFNRFNTMVAHKETDAEASKRKSLLYEDTAKFLYQAIREKLEKTYAGKLGKVYIDEKMKKIALPLQESASSHGYGVLSKGSRIPIEKGKKVRAFTYWEKVDDIDLSVIGIRKDGSQVEFSWRTMCSKQSEMITFSGDQTAGYYGGSEYFDINVDLFREEYPEMEYLVFCDNVFSRQNFSSCICRAGYMLRDLEDSGEVYEPKTVKSSFTVDCDSTFAYLFAIDLAKAEFVWLNVARDSMAAIAGTTSFGFLTKYFNVTSVMNMADFFQMLATEVVTDIAEADVIVTDAEVEAPESATVIRSCDFEKVMALMNS